jgi:hypothetical protein
VKTAPGPSARFAAWISPRWASAISRAIASPRPVPPGLVVKKGSTSQKPFLVAALATVAASTWFLRGAHEVVWIAILVVLFAENGIGRAVVESLIRIPEIRCAISDPGFPIANDCRGRI